MTTSPPSSQESTDVVCIASEPFSAKPLIAEILRTRYCIPGSVFLVEGVDVFHASRSKRWRAVRLILGDGEFCVQALLSGEMHRYLDGGDLAVGSYVKLEAFRLEHIHSKTHSDQKSRRSDKTGRGAARNPAYLIVDNLIVVGWNKRLLSMLEDTETTRAAGNAAQNAGPEKEGMDDTVDIVGRSAAAPSIHPQHEIHDLKVLEELAGADDDFETLDVPEQKTSQGRAEVAAQPFASDYSVPVDVNNLPWSSTDPSKPLKLTTLRSIPTLPYKQNWSTNILAVISSLSDVEPCTMPPFKQRVARLSHPSTPKQVHLTVFLDPEEFAPQVGSVVLLLGVKNHRFDGGSLKKYASDRMKDRGRWWYENPYQFTWCDVAALKRWWDHQQT
ncbi:hypothetical protein JX266_009666 [Neoarthrinium moseri]|nr:hypothetical protein JX266_009666 [Neoarthrinium moseri]